jgi:hypothetical protein
MARAGDSGDVSDSWFTREGCTRLPRLGYAEARLERNHEKL